MRIAYVFMLVAWMSAFARAERFDYTVPSGEVIPGAGLSDTPALATQVARVRAAVKSALEVDIGNIPVHLVTMEELRALHSELGGKLPHGYSIYGFEYDGHVFVRRALAGVPDEVVIHECLHALSERFNAQLNAQGVHKMVEGITQYLTLEALAARPTDPRLRPTKNSTYVAYTQFADTLATLVGEGKLREAYFGGGAAQLATRVDALTHSRRVLLRAAHALEGGDERAATSILTNGK